MLDELAIPVLAVVVALFLIYLGIGWIGSGKNRAIVIPDEDESDLAREDRP